ncbi:hypothetical protein [Limosilactobacillus reuteri]|uniref:Uncharacterized protein n=1 Tax=Limosilactobacillus reuteri TaxID=1598 RepID=A0ABD6Y7H7_LIMRT|nr:hypothetical protein [Limosilactobacillus reuteri]PWT37681.1 hypothetical protein DKZ35_04175 [Limosilactobacillus reuteri]
MRKTKALSEFKELSKSDKYIIREYADYDHVNYGHDRFINIDNKIFSMNEINETTKGFYIWLSTYKQVDRRGTKIIIPRLTINWMIKEIGITTNSSYAVRTFTKMLSNLSSIGLIDIDVDLKHLEKNQTFTVILKNARAKYKYFTQIYIGNIDMIIDNKNGFEAFKYCFSYAAIRSFITEKKEDTKVITLAGKLIQERMHLSKASYYRRLDWLKDHHIIAMFMVQMLNEYGNRKILISDIRDMQNLIITINDWKSKKIISSVIR